MLQVPPAPFARSAAGSKPPPKAKKQEKQKEQERQEEQEEHRSHFGSRYKSGCCGFAGLFAAARFPQGRGRKQGGGGRNLGN